MASRLFFLCCIAPIALAKIVTVDFTGVKGVVSGGVGGTIRFQQVGLGSVTDVLLSLTGLSSQSYKWHVHSFPATAGCASTAGHYNPLK